MDKYGDDVLKMAEGKVSDLVGQEMTLEGVMNDPKAALKVAASLDAVKSLENSLTGATGLEISADSLIDDPMAVVKAELTADKLLAAGNKTGATQGLESLLKDQAGVNLSVEDIVVDPKTGVVSTLVGNTDAISKLAAKGADSGFLTESQSN